MMPGLINAITANKLIFKLILFALHNTLKKRFINKNFEPITLPLNYLVLIQKQAQTHKNADLIELRL